MDMYPGSLTWQARVNRMPDNRVYAIWRDYQERMRRKMAETSVATPSEDENFSHPFHQITIFEYLNDKEG